MKNKKAMRSIPGIKRYVVGKGFTEQQKYRIKWDADRPLSPEALVLLKKSGPKGLNPFDGKILRVEASARRILENAGLPTDPRKGNTFSLIKAGGYRERIDQEWFAAKILLLAHYIRGTMADGVGDDGRLSQGIAWTVLSLAADLGELVGEGKALGYFARTGKTGGDREKKIRPLFEWVRETVKQYPDKRAPFYWNSIPDDFEGDRPLRINDAEMIREGDLLMVFYENGRRPSITFSSFRRYVTDAKKSLKL